MKYDNPKVKIGDWVYFYDSEENYKTKCKYKVICVKQYGGIIVEVNNNEEDKRKIPGWETNDRDDKKIYNLPSNIKAWHVSHWRKNDRGMKIE